MFLSSVRVSRVNPHHDPVVLFCSWWPASCLPPRRGKEGPFRVLEEEFHSAKAEAVVHPCSPGKHRVQSLIPGPQVLFPVPILGDSQIPGMIAPRDLIPLASSGICTYVHACACGTHTHTHKITDKNLNMCYHDQLLFMYLLILMWVLRKKRGSLYLQGKYYTTEPSSQPLSGFNGFYRTLLGIWRIC